MAGQRRIGCSPSGSCHDFGEKSHASQCIKQGSARDLLGGIKERYHFVAVESIDDVYSVTRPLSIDYLENRFNLDRNSCGKRGKSNRAAGVVTITFLTVNLMD